MDEDTFFTHIMDSKYPLLRVKMLLGSPTDLRRLREAHRILGDVVLKWEYLEEQYVGNLRATSRSY